MATVLAITLPVIPVPPKPKSMTFDVEMEAYLNALRAFQAAMVSLVGQLNTVIAEVNATALDVAGAQDAADQAISAAATASGKADAAAVSETSAAASATTATAKAGEATTASEAAQAAQTASETARDDSQAAKTASETATATSTAKAGEATTAAEAAQAAQTASETARDDSQAAQTASEAAAATATSAKTDALAARDESVTAAATATTKASEAANSASDALASENAAAASAAAAAEIAAGSIPDATEEAAGKIALATSLMMVEATDDTTAVTPLKGGQFYASKEHTHVASNVGATALPSPGVIPLSDEGGTLDTWISSATASNAGLVLLASNAGAALAETATAGTSDRVAREDHTHELPTPTDIGALPITGGTMAGPVNLASWLDTHTDLGTVSGGTLTINLSLGASFSMTTGAAITSVVFTGAVPEGWRGGVEVEVTNGGAYAWVWGSIRWPGRAAPSLTASGLDILIFKISPTGTPIGAVAMKDIG